MITYITYMTYYVIGISNSNILCIPFDSLLIIVNLLINYFKILSTYLVFEGRNYFFYFMVFITETCY